MACVAKRRVATGADALNSTSMLLVARGLRPAFRPCERETKQRMLRSGSAPYAVRLGGRELTTSVWCPRSCSQEC